MKLSNFASLDPYPQSRGIIGLQNASKADHEIWEEFNANWSHLAVESEAVYQQLVGDDEVVTSVKETSLPTYRGMTETEQIVKIRIGQNFFRKVILTSYANKCCICGLPIPELLIASHIIPWRDDEKLRVNPQNGLCLCALHDKSFDRGLITVSSSYEVIIGQGIRQYLPDEIITRSFELYAGTPIKLPDKFPQIKTFYKSITRNILLDNPLMMPYCPGTS